MVYDARPDPITEDNEFNRTILGGKKDKRVNVPILFDRGKMLQVAQALRELADSITAEVRGPADAPQIPMRTVLLSVGWQVDQFNRRSKIIKDAYEMELRETRERVTPLRERAG